MNEYQIINRLLFTKINEILLNFVKYLTSGLLGENISAKKNLLLISFRYLLHVSVDYLNVNEKIMF